MKQTIKSAKSAQKFIQPAVEQALKMFDIDLSATTVTVSVPKWVLVALSYGKCDGTQGTVGLKFTKGINGKEVWIILTTESLEEYQARNEYFKAEAEKN